MKLIMGTVISTESVPNRPLSFPLDALYERGIVVDSSFGRRGDPTSERDIVCIVTLTDTNLHIRIEVDEIEVDKIDIEWEYMEKEIANGIIEERFGPLTLNLPATLRRIKGLLPLLER